jgi:PPM family protein phosphatase
MVQDLSAALEIVTRTDPGKVRSHNEDAVFGNAGRGLAVLADGMGGYNAGEVASRMATALLGGELAKVLADRAPDRREGDGQLWAHVALGQVIVRANAAIHQAAESQPQYAGMGTTLVATLFHDDMVTVAHVGDSRLYRLRGDDFRPLTRDHSLLQEQIDSGIISAEQARYSQNKNLVTRALGVDPTVEAEIHDHDARPGDIYLLCSDGLNDMVDDDEISLTLATLSANLPLCASQLIDMANDNGGRDNVSVILVKVTKAFPASRGWWAKLMAWFR